MYKVLEVFFVLIYLNVMELYLERIDIVVVWSMQLESAWRLKKPIQRIAFQKMKLIHSNTSASFPATGFSVLDTL